MLLTLKEAQIHLRVEEDILVEDNAIIDMIATATVACADYLNVPVEQLGATSPSPIKSAALLLVGDLYANREAQSDTPLHTNRTFERLLNPYRSMGF